MSNLYDLTNYTNEYIDYLYNVEIIEYDMVDAGLSLCKKYRLLPNDVIEHLGTLSKKERMIAIGKMQERNIEFNRSLNESFRLGRQLFFEENNLSVDNVLSIKKDAIFTLQPCIHVDFEELQFAEKNKYSSYYKFDRYEYYYFNEGLDVKGISDEKLLKHADYMLSSLHEFMFLMENANNNKLIKFVKDFTHYYKFLQLPIGYYRELNSDSLFRTFLKADSKSFAIESIDDKKDIMINYNYNVYLTPLIDFVLRRG